jgi:signal transduction histidine kinase
LPKRQRSRTWIAAALLVGAIATLLVAWFFSGWADVRAQQRELRAGPTRAAELKAASLASELRSELARLVVREAERDYFHYQNLYHDPRTGPSFYVSTSPLATGPKDELVLGYFNLDHKGRLTTPTINDEAPHLSEPTRLAENRQFRDEVVRSFASKIPTTPAIDTSTLGADVVAEVAKPVKKKQVPPSVKSRIAEEEQLQQQSTKVVQLDVDSYAQNAAPNEVYWSNYIGNDSRNAYRNYPGNNPRTTQESAQLPEETKERLQVTRQEKQQPKPKTSIANERATPEDADQPKRVTVTISPFEWRTYPFAGQAALVALRHVDTPDGKIWQGFVVDRSTLTSWLASRAGESVAEIVVSNEGGSNEIAPGWELTVAANPRTLVGASAMSSEIATSFLARFVIIGFIAALAAMLVVGLVARAERMARERSQFAAAAAHELRTPLAGLQLYGDMLADGLGNPDKLRDYAKRMSEEASRLGRVVSNVLGFSQLERGNLSVEAKSGPLGEVLKELAERAEPALDRAGATLALDVSPDLRARYDRDAVIRIVGNLLDNAEKYGRGADDRTIELAAKETDAHVEVTVSDHGPGITQAARAKLFQVFSRGVDADGPAGLGLGLALSRSLAHAMSGELDYRDGTGGATFVLRLPKATES